MKQNKKSFDKDISNVKTTYTYCLIQNQEELSKISEDYNVNNETFVDRVIEMIQPANDTNAKRNFISSLKLKKYKNDSVLYVYNALMCGQGLGVNI